MNRPIDQADMSDEMRRFILESEEADRKIAAVQIRPVDSYSGKFEESPGVLAPGEESPWDKMLRESRDKGSQWAWWTPAAGASIAAAAGSLIALAATGSAWLSIAQAVALAGIMAPALGWLMDRGSRPLRRRLSDRLQRR